MLLLAAAPAQGGLITSSSDEGSLPHAYGGGFVDSPKQPPHLVVKMWPAVPVEISVSVQCWKGKMHRSTDRDLPSTSSPFSGVVALTIKHPDDCYVSADVSFEDYEVDGRIILTLRSPYAR